ncbi:MAG: hypothetical protein AAF829_05610 [Pseudomonadota bacterium]
MSIRNTLLRTALAASATLALAGVAQAQKTDAGTSVGNVFALDYTVGGVQQGRITNDPADDLNSGYTGPAIVDTGAGATEFTVDRLVDFIITQLNSPLDTPPGATQVASPTGSSAALRELMFSITNNGNDHSAYSFQIEEVTTPSTGADEFLSTNRTIRFYRDAFDLDGTTGDSSGCEAVQNEVITVTTVVAEGTTPSASAPFVAPDAQLTCDLAPGETAFVFIGADIPEIDVSADALTEGDEDNLILIAQARNPQRWVTETIGSGASGPGAVTQEDTDGNTLDGAAEVVLAEGSGSATGDVTSDGVFSASANWLIIDPDLSATKAVALLDQTASAAACSALTGPFTPTSEYYIPGSCVEYTITVTNTGDAAGSDAEGISLTDPLPADMVYVSHTVGGDFTLATVEVDTTLAGTTDCTANTDTGCVVKLTGATLASATSGDTVGTLVIRAYLP